MSTVLRLQNYFIWLAETLDCDDCDGTFDGIKDSTIFGVPLTTYIERAEWIDANIIGGAIINDHYEIWDTFQNVFIFSDNESAMAYKLRWL